MKRLGKNYKLRQLAYLLGIGEAPEAAARLASAPSSTYANLSGYLLPFRRQSTKFIDLSKCQEKPAVNEGKAPGKAANISSMKEWMSFKVIRDQESLTLFQAETARRIQVELPLDYLERAKVVALISRDGRRIYGGFVIAHAGGLRALEQLPAGLAESHSYLKSRQHACFEVNGFWLNHRDARSFACLSLYFACFVQFVLQAARGKYYFVYAFDASKKSLGQMFALFNSVRIFEGEVKALPGMSGPGREIVEVCSLPRLLYAAAKNPGFVFRRMGPRRRKKAYA